MTTSRRPWDECGTLSTYTQVTEAQRWEGISQAP